MANQVEQPGQWPMGIYQIATTDPVLGGPEGPPNVMGRALAERTLYQRLANVTPWSADLAQAYGYPAGACVRHGLSTWRAVVDTTAEPGTDGAAWERWAFSQAELDALISEALGGGASAATVHNVDTTFEWGSFPAGAQSIFNWIRATNFGPAETVVKFGPGNYDITLASMSGFPPNVIIEGDTDNPANVVFSSAAAEGENLGSNVHSGCLRIRGVRIEASQSCAISCRGTATVVIESGQMVSTAPGYPGLYATGSSSVVVMGGEFIAGGTSTGAYVHGSARAAIYGGTFSSGSSGSGLEVADSATVHVIDGDFNAGTNGHGLKVSGAAKVSVIGGTFDAGASGNGISTFDSSNLSIYGGSFKGGPTKYGIVTYGASRVIRRGGTLVPRSFGPVDYIAYDGSIIAHWAGLGALNTVQKVATWGVDVAGASIFTMHS